MTEMHTGGRPYRQPQKPRLSIHGEITLEALRALDNIIPSPENKVPFPAAPNVGEAPRLSKRLIDLTPCFNVDRDFKEIPGIEPTEEEVRKAATEGITREDLENGYWKLRKILRVDQLGSSLRKEFGAYAEFVSDVKDIIKGYEGEYKDRTEATYRLAIEQTRKSPGVYIHLEVINRNEVSRSGRPRHSTSRQTRNQRVEDQINDRRLIDSLAKVSEERNHKEHPSTSRLLSESLAISLNGSLDSEQIKREAREFLQACFAKHAAPDVALAITSELIDRGRYSGPKEAVLALDKFAKEIAELKPELTPVIVLRLWHENPIAEEAIKLLDD